MKFLNRMEIFNELTLLVISYSLFSFTEFIPDVEFRYSLGWGFIAIVAFNITINWVALMYRIIRTIVIIVKNYLVRRGKAKKAANYDEKIKFK